MCAPSQVAQELNGLLVRWQRMQQQQTSSEREECDGVLGAGAVASIGTGTLSLALVPVLVLRRDLMRTERFWCHLGHLRRIQEQAGRC